MKRRWHRHSLLSIVVSLISIVVVTVAPVVYAEVGRAAPPSARTFFPDMHGLRSETESREPKVS